MNREKRCQLSLPPPPRDTINLARDTARCSAQPDVKRVRYEKKKAEPEEDRVVRGNGRNTQMHIIGNNKRWR